MRIFTRAIHVADHVLLLAHTDAAAGDSFTVMLLPICRRTNDASCVVASHGSVCLPDMRAL